MENRNGMVDGKCGTPVREVWYRAGITKQKKDRETAPAVPYTRQSLIGLLFARSSSRIFSSPGIYRYNAV